MGTQKLDGRSKQCEVEQEVENSAFLSENGCNEEKMKKKTKKKMNFLWNVEFYFKMIWTRQL